MVKKSLSLVLVIIVLLIVSCSDDSVSPDKVGKISGQVLDAENADPIAGVSISTNPGTDALFTDASGNYTIYDVEEGVYTIKATKKDYDNQTVSINVKEDKTTVANIIMSLEEEDNLAPNVPQLHTPENNSDAQVISDLLLSWRCTDPNSKDTLTYDLYLCKSEETMTLYSADITDTTYTISDLIYGTTYYWQITAKDEDGEITNGPIWSFSTEAMPEHRIVFASKKNNDYEIFSISASDSIIMQLTDRPGRDWYPKLSPDRKKIAFSSNREIEPYIYVMDRDGSNLDKISTTPMTGFNNYGTGLCWSPNGRKILFSHYNTLYRIDSDGDNLLELASAPEARHFKECSWSPTNNKIVALTIGSSPYESEIQIMDINGDNMQELIGDLPGVMGHPSFSPDGKHIAFHRDISGHEVADGRMLDSHIFIMHIDSTYSVDTVVDISTFKTAGTNDMNPVWSPDGSQIIFNNQTNDETAPAEVWIMNIHQINENNDDRKMLTNDGLMPDWR